MPRRQLIGVALGLLGLVAWEAGGWDLAVSAFYGDAGGFAWRDRFLTRDLLHAGGRWLSTLVLVLLLADAVHPLVPGPPRHLRWSGVLGSLLGLPGFEFDVWFILSAPAKTPKTVVETISADVRKVLALPEIVKALEVMGAMTAPRTPDETQRFVAKELRSYAEVAKAANVPTF